MGREVRRVPANWKHPIDPKTGGYVPLFYGKDYLRDVYEWDEGAAMWGKGLRCVHNGAWKPIGNEESKSYEDWAGQRPKLEDYMPQWTDLECTHLMMYENTTEGTPISPALKTPEELAKYLVDNKASWFGNETGSYEGWLRLARGG